MSIDGMKRAVLALAMVMAAACGAVAQTVVSHMHYANHAAPGMSGCKRGLWPLKDLTLTSRSIFSSRLTAQASISS